MICKKKGFSYPAWKLPYHSGGKPKNVSSYLASQASNGYVILQSFVFVYQILRHFNQIFVHSANSFSLFLGSIVVVVFVILLY